MSVTRIIAKACWLCGKPVVEDSDKPDEAWLMLAGELGAPAHVACANRATKERLIQEEKPPAQ